MGNCCSKKATVFGSHWNNDLEEERGLILIGHVIKACPIIISLIRSNRINGASPKGNLGENPRKGFHLTQE